MNFRHPLIRLLFIRPFLSGIAGVVSLSPLLCDATETGSTADEIERHLPELPGSDADAPGYFSMAEESAAIGYETRFETLNATLDRYFGLAPSVTVDYGLQLTSKFGAGGIYTRESDQSELVLNVIFAPKRNLRFRFTGAQMRHLGEAVPNGADPVLQNSYLIGAKKYWSKYRYLSDIGIATYAVKANTAATMTADSEAFDAGDMSDSLALGDLRAYRLDLGMQPSARSRLEWRREISRLTYLSTSERRDETVASNRIKYSHHLGNCMQLQSAYSMNSGTDHLDLQLARNNWAVRISRELEGVGDTAINLSYAIPLGSTSQRQRTCNDTSAPSPRFAPLLDAAVARPPQLPEGALSDIAIP